MLVLSKFSKVDEVKLLKKPLDLRGEQTCIRKTNQSLWSRTVRSPLEVNFFNKLGDIKNEYSYQ